MDFTHLFDITHFKNNSLFLPNSVQLVSNGNIVVADGGNDRICLFSSNGSSLKEVGGKGVGKYYFKEPVGAFTSPSDRIYVMDWHNHRVVVLDKDLNYIDEFGHFGGLNPPVTFKEKIKTVLRLFRKAAIDGSYIQHHFKNKVRKNEERYVPLDTFTKSVLYLIKLITSNIVFGNFKIFLENNIQKPNGVAFLNNKLYLTQKNSRCISAHVNNDPYKRLKNQKEPRKGTKFGRLGNIVVNENNLFVCDERQGIIWKLNSQMEYMDHIDADDLDLNEFLPFAACFINQRLMATCGGESIHIIDREKKKCVYSPDIKGEFHGIAFHGQSERLLIADRGHNKIRVFNLNFEKSKFGDR